MFPGAATLVLVVKDSDVHETHIDLAIASNGDVTAEVDDKAEGDEKTSC